MSRRSIARADIGDWRADAATTPLHPHAVAATRRAITNYNIRLLRIPIVVRQRVDINVVVRALEVQVLALHV
jgi:hypothetical protein